MANLTAALASLLVALATGSRPLALAGIAVAAYNLVVGMAVLK